MFDTTLKQVYEDLPEGVSPHCGYAVSFLGLKFDPDTQLHRLAAQHETWLGIYMPPNLT